MNINEDEMAKMLGLSGDTPPSASPRAPKPASKGRRAGPTPLLGGTPTAVGSSFATPLSTTATRKPLSSKLNESSSDDEPPLEFLGSAQPKRRATPLGTVKKPDNVVVAVPPQVMASPVQSGEVEELRMKLVQKDAEVKVAAEEAERKTKELEEKVKKMESENMKLTEERRMQDDLRERQERERENAMRDLESTRREGSKLAAENDRLQNKLEDVDSLNIEIRTLRETVQSARSDLTAERRKVSELHQAQADPSYLPYTPPPEIESLAVDIPKDAPLSYQFQVMLHNTAQQLISYQKSREEAMMASLREAQKNWSDEMLDREVTRGRVEKEELEKWRGRMQEERQEREKRDVEERILRNQRDEQERTDRERQHREEKAMLIQQELAERESWGGRIHDEHQQTIERITLGFSTTQEQMTSSYEAQIRSVKQQAEEERVHNRKLVERQLLDMEKKYAQIGRQQTEAHKEVITSLMQFKETMVKLNRCQTVLEMNAEQQKELKNKWEHAMENTKKEKERSLEDRGKVLEELRKAVSEKHQQVDQERLMLSRLFADFKVTIDNIKRQQEDERSRLTASIIRAEKAKDDYEKEHRKWMRDSLQQRLDLDADHTDSIHKILSAVEDLKEERGNLQQERRDFDRSRDAARKHTTELETKIESKKTDLENFAVQITKKEESVRQAGEKIHQKMMELQQEATVLSAEKEKLRDELYRVKELGNMAYQKSKDLQVVKGEIMAAAEAVQHAKEGGKTEDRVRIERDREELERLRKVVQSEERELKRKKVLFTGEKPTSAPVSGGENISPGTLRELFEQKQFLSGVRPTDQLPPPSITTHPPSPSPRAHSSGVTAPPRSTDRRTDDLPESMIGQQWVTLFKLSEDGSSDSFSGRPSPYPSSSPYTSSPSSKARY